jgi:hypothetical protein
MFERFAGPPPCLLVLGRNGPVLDSQEDKFFLFCPVFVGYLTGIENHHLVPDLREDVINLVTTHFRLFRQDLLQEFAQTGNFPLTVPQFVELCTGSTGIGQTPLSVRQPGFMS